MVQFFTQKLPDHLLSKPYQSEPLTQTNKVYEDYNFLKFVDHNFVGQTRIVFTPCKIPILDVKPNFKRFELIVFSSL